MVRDRMEAEVEIAAGTARLPGRLAVPGEAAGIVVFTHGSGSSRRSLARYRLVHPPYGGQVRHQALTDQRSRKRQAVRPLLWRRSGDRADSDSPKPSATPSSPPTATTSDPGTDIRSCATSESFPPPARCCATVTPTRPPGASCESDSSRPVLTTTGAGHPSDGISRHTAHLEPTKARLGAPARAWGLRRRAVVGGEAAARRCTGPGDPAHVEEAEDRQDQ